MPSRSFVNIIMDRKSWSPATFFLAFSPVVTFVSMAFYFYSGNRLHWQTCVLSVVMYALIMLSICAGYHRLFAHRAYESKTLLKVFFLLFGAASFQESVLWWCTHHRNHHAYTDTDKDPHNIKEGFFFAHMGWILPRTEMDLFEQKNISDLLKDPWIVWQDRYLYQIAFLVGIVMPCLLGWLWHDFWGALIFAVGFRIILLSHATFCINSLAHLVGKKPYNEEISARDNFLMSLLTFGEGYHNYHHAYPFDYRNGRRWYNFDPSKWIIFLLSKVGVTKDLRRA